MKYLLITTLVSILIAGCAPSVATNIPATISPTNAPSGNPKIASIAREGNVTEEASNGQNGSSTPAVVMTVKSPPILLVPIQESTVVPAPSPTPVSTQGWKTYTSALLRVAVDYPPDWSAAEESDGVTFTSPQGLTIFLKISPLNGVLPGLTSQRCLSRTNAHQVQAEVCVGTASYFSYTASFKIVSSDGKTHQLTLSTLNRESAAIFEAMFESIRSA